MSIPNNPKSNLTVNEAIERLSRLAGDDRIAVPYDPGIVTIGGSSSTPIVDIFAGFDWDHGTVFFQTGTRLGVIGDEFQRLKEHLMVATEALAWIGRQTNDKRLDQKEKLSVIKRTLEQYRVRVNKLDSIQPADSDVH
ncbi:hypothetical protein LptCag_1523 [Leptospirillum ferriphilum]|uniref:Uncharacterized protein n=1 Tax=Leptospirillum ferriphilum TaxID=178606 RepID=A0A094W8F2_9BACT|nr:hypothetical protein [Leptospirillum ferriphilum]KGA93813.1 hypothetical protein LptCag_1523 [Leptospirillum ferriphilum]